jgi:hypothetical protein
MKRYWWLVPLAEVSSQIYSKKASCQKSFNSIKYRYLWHTGKFFVDGLKFNNWDN